jgi:WD40 repeat protein
MMRRLIVAVLMLTVGMGVGAQQDAPVTKLFEKQVPLSDSGSPIVHVVWSPDGNYLATASATSYIEHTVRLSWSVYDAVTGESISQDVEFLAWYVDSTHVLTFVRDTGSYLSLNLRTRETIVIDPYGERSAETFERLVFDHIILNGRGRVLEVYDAQTGQLIKTIYDNTEQPHYSADRSQVVVTTSKGIDIYDTATWTLVDSLPGYFLNWRPSDPLWSPDNRHLVVVSQLFSRPFIARYIWTVGEGLSAPIYNLDSSVWWSPDGTQMAEGNDADLRFFDSTSGEIVWTARNLPYADGQTFGNGSISTANGTYLVTIHGDFRIGGRVFAAVTNSQTRQAVFQESIELSYVTLWDDKLYVHQASSNFRMYDLSGKNTPTVLDVPNPHARLSPNGQWLLSYVQAEGEDASNKAILFRLDPLEQFLFDTSVTEIGDMTWSPDGRRFAVYGGDANMISVWEIIAD